MRLPDIWYHWSSSGVLLADPLHAGTEQQALQRKDDLSRVPWDAPDLSSLVPTYWRQGEHSRMFRLRLLRPVVNPTAPVQDHEIYDFAGVPVLYLNGAEGEGLSVCAPLKDWEEAA